MRGKAEARHNMDMPKGWWRLRRKRVYIPLILLALMMAAIARPAWVLTRAWVSDRDQRRHTPAGMVDDASRLDQTPVSQVWNVPADEAAAETGLRVLLERARQQHQHVSIAGARHSMGGQTIWPSGIQINMLPHCAMQFDAKTQLLHVQAGAIWKQVLDYLDPLKLSVAIMQSNNDFSVGGSISVNCHGWQYGQPPIDSSVDSLRLMLADGSIRRCSRTENPVVVQFGAAGI